jgi:hypothetical protein
VHFCVNEQRSGTALRDRRRRVALLANEVSARELTSSATGVMRTEVWLSAATSREEEETHVATMRKGRPCVGTILLAN